VPVFEDTQFLLAPAHSPAEGVRLPAAAQDMTQPLFLDAVPAVERTTSLAVYEDTQLLARGLGLDRTATLAVYEDTGLVPQSRANPSAQSSPVLRAAGSADATAPLQLYEDTQFLTRALPRSLDGRPVTPFAEGGADPVRTPATEVQQVRCSGNIDVRNRKSAQLGQSGMDGAPALSLCIALTSLKLMHELLVVSDSHLLLMPSAERSHQPVAHLHRTTSSTTRRTTVSPASKPLLTADKPSGGQQ